MIYDKLVTPRPVISINIMRATATEYHSDQHLWYLISSLLLFLQCSSFN